MEVPIRIIIFGLAIVALALLVSNLYKTPYDTKRISIAGLQDDPSVFVPVLSEGNLYITRLLDPVDENDQERVTYFIDLKTGKVALSDSLIDTSATLRPPRYWSREMPPDQRRLGTYPQVEPPSAPSADFCSARAGRSDDRAVIESAHLGRTIVVCQSEAGSFSWYLSSKDGWQNLGTHGGPRPLSTGLVVELPDESGESLFSHATLLTNFAVRIDVTDGRLSEAKIPNIDQIDLRNSLSSETPPTNVMRVGSSIVTLVEGGGLCVASHKRGPECFDDVLGAVKDDITEKIFVLRYDGDQTELISIGAL